jgi:DNA-binding NarL/FixJ family response regulator
MTGVPNILICEGSRSYADGLRQMLEHEGDITVTAVCDTAEEAIAALPSGQAWTGSPRSRKS